MGAFAADAQHRAVSFCKSDHKEDGETEGDEASGGENSKIQTRQPGGSLVDDRERAAADRHSELLDVDSLTPPSESRP
jgi:hypothetical protein